MLNWLRRLSAQMFSPKRAQAGRKVRLELEPLEDRRVMSVTNHGGALLKNVEVQGLYYGADWAKDFQAANLDLFLKSTVQGSYMDMLNKAGYGVGKGSSDPGQILQVSLDKTKSLTDAQIQRDLGANIQNGFLKPVDANRLY